MLIHAANDPFCSTHNVCRLEKTSGQQSGSAIGKFNDKLLFHIQHDMHAQDAADEYTHSSALSTKPAAQTWS